MIETNTLLAIILGAILCLLSLGIVLFSRGKEIKRRKEVEAELRMAAADADERLHARTKSLRQSRKLLISIVEGMPDVVFLKEGAPDGYLRYVLVNKAGEELLGKSRDEIVGRTDMDLFPAYAALSAENDHRALLENGPIDVVERTIDTPAGPRVLEVRKLVVPGEEDCSRYILGIARDITSHRETEEQLRHSLRMDAVGQLTGGVAHDFNNLLAIILGNLDSVREQMNDSSDSAEMMDAAIKATMHGAELVRRLLAFARKQNLAPTSVDLNKRLTAISSMLRRTLGENIEVRTKSAPDLWDAFVDPTQVDDALVNLAINARDAMKQGGCLTIETQNVVLDEDYTSQHLELTAGEYVVLAVSDTGSGMPPDVIARAFEPFYTTKPEGEGSGLGLSQVYGWVKQSGGHIKIYSEVGHGTTIKLYLPRADAHREETSSEAASAGATPGGRERIFIVEDNHELRNTVRRQLMALGYSTIEAEDGKTAVAMVKAGAEFDLLLTDIVMPGGMTGYELADQVGKLRPGRKVLFTSGYTELAASDGQEAPTGPLLSKPYRKQDLGRALRSLLDRSD